MLNSIAFLFWALVAISLAVVKILYIVVTFLARAILRAFGLDIFPLPSSAVEVAPMQSASLPNCSLASDVKPGVRFVDDWLFRDKENPGFARPGLIVLLSQNRPATAGMPGFDWFDFDEQVGGMSMRTLRAYAALDLGVPKEILAAVLEKTDWSRGDVPDSGWRHDLSWGNTKLDGPNDPTVKAYLAAIEPLGLTWTVPSELSVQPDGIKLAQAAYPFDATDANLRALGVSDSIQRLLGGPADPSVHSIVLLTPNDD